MFKKKEGGREEKMCRKMYISEKIYSKKKEMGTRRLGTKSLGVGARGERETPTALGPTDG